MFARHHKTANPIKRKQLRHPKKVGTPRVPRSIQRLYDAGSLRNLDVYHDFPSRVYRAFPVKAFAPTVIPVFLFIHLPILLIQLVNYLTFGEYLDLPAGRTLVVGGYILAIAFGSLRFKEYRAYVKNHVATYRGDAQRLHEELVLHVESGDDKDDARELKRLNRARMDVVQTVLFPTQLDLDMVAQMNHQDENSGVNPRIQRAARRRQALSKSNRREEHFAAKRVADDKQLLHGGKNEYDELVKKYEKHMAPSMRDLVIK